MELNVNIMAWNYVVNGMLLNLIKNLYVPFGIPFDAKRYYKDGDCTRMLRRPRYALPLGIRAFSICSKSWRRLFDIRGPLVHELILEFFSTFRFGEAESERQIPDKGDLRDYWIGISSTRDFLGTTPSYTYFRDPILRMCHSLIASSIARRSQAPKKVTVTDLFYLRGMDVGSGPTVIRQELPVIDMVKLAVKDTPAVEEGTQADLALMQAPQPPPPPPARTMPQRLGRLKEDM
ncbi:hypothetical protein Tco_1363513 [Tanacetum coccineum]